MDKTLFISDLDGTLLREDATLSPKTIKEINAFIARGNLFSYATARSYYGSSRLTSALNLSAPVTVYNGTFIMNPQTDAQLFASTLPKDAAARPLAVMDAMNLLPVAYSFMDGQERISWVKGRETEGIARYVTEKGEDGRLRPVDKTDKLLEGELFYLTAIDSRIRMEALNEALDGMTGLSLHLLRDTYFPSEYWLEISPEEAGKGKALHRLKAMLGVERAVCFGDNLNDLPLFEACDEGYAVANAHPALKAAATGIIGGNNEDGVAEFLSKL